MKHLFFASLIFLCMSSYAQDVTDTSGRQFHDDLLDHLVGSWRISSTAHGHEFTSELEGSWVLNHQYLLIHLKSNEVIPWWGVQMEYYEYLGYNHHKKHYTVHGVSIEGDEDLSEGFAYGYRNGNEFKTVSKFGVDTNIVQRFFWHPENNTWTFETRPEINGKEGDVFLEMLLTRRKP